MATNPCALAAVQHVPTRLPRWLHGRPLWVAWSILAGTLFVWLCQRPLWHTDIWGHLAYGRHIWLSGELPTVEPLLPLAGHPPLIDTAWLSQLIGYAVYSAAGVAGLQLLFGTAVASSVVLLGVAAQQRIPSFAAALVGGALFLWVDWQQLQIIRPQLAGVVCFLALWLLLTDPRQRFGVVYIALLFCLWANLHGSFPLGLLLVGCFAAGRALDIWRRAPRVRFVLADRKLHRLALYVLIAASAVLLNPYGWALYREVATFSNHPNLHDLVEWKPLTLSSAQGQAAAVLFALLVVAWCTTPRRIRTTEWLLVIGLGVATLWASRMLTWWAPIAAYYTACHGSAACRRFGLGRNRQAFDQPARPLWSLLAAGIAVLALGNTAIALQRESSAAAFSAQTPVAAVQHLCDRSASAGPPRQMFHTFEWGDYLLWAGPQPAPVFVASHVHLIPVDVWRDYLRVIGGSTDWEAILARYAVDVVLIDPIRHGRLARRLRENSHWSVDYVDDRSILFIRRS